jgi:hypothetical protein
MLKREKQTILPAHKVRGRPFKPGNPGRPRGSKNRTTRMLEEFAEGQAQQLVQKVLELAPGRRRVLSQDDSRPRLSATQGPAD